MSTIRWGLCLALLIFATSVSVAQQSQLKREKVIAWQTEGWKTYCDAIHYYQERFPSTVYRPIELLPIQRLDQKKFLPHAINTVKNWKRLHEVRDETDRNAQKRAASQIANEELRKLLKDAGLWEVGVFFSQREIVSAVPESLRLAMTPFDPSFLEISEIGKKIKEDLNTIQWSEFTEVKMETEKGIMTFAGRPNNPFAKALSKLQPVYRIESTKMPGSETLFRGRNLVTKSLMLPDLKINAGLLAGTIFNQQSKSNFPMGKFVPTPKGIAGEKPHMHFDGDGHKH